MPLPLDLERFDAVFAARMSSAEWQRIKSFRELKNFDKALRVYSALMPQYFSDNILLNKVVTEAWRFEMLVYTLYLYDARDNAIPQSGLTVSNLKRICAQQNCASSGRVVAILSIMRLAGFLQQLRSEADARIKHLVPTKKFIATVEGWNQRIFQIIDAVTGDTLAPQHLNESRFGWDMRKRGAECLLAGWKLLDPFPEVFHFVSSDGGWMFLLHCVAEALKNNKIAAISVDLVAQGKRFGVSRSHLRRLLESAHQEGLLGAPPRNGTDIRLSPLLIASFLNCMASELSFYHGNATNNGALPRVAFV